MRAPTPTAAAEFAVPAINDLAKRGVKAVVMFTAGFAEMDDDGAVAQAGMVCTENASVAPLGPLAVGWKE